MKKGALFIDRDGVINRMVMQKEGYFDSPQMPEQVELVPGVVEILRLLNSQKIPVLEITNQPAPAKNKMTFKMQEKIEARIHELLKKEGVFVDKTYTCLHHPQSVILKYKIDCDCRKPKPGLIFAAAKEFDIDLSKSIFLGDNSTDVEAGKSAGTKTILFFHTNDVSEKVEKNRTVVSDFHVESLKEVLPILKNHFI
jgi:D-glycero-D-manno-heptose 1,7-bisphosphate phosphatase